jgi:hypothetical protein
MEQEQAYFDNMSEAMQAGDGGTAAQDALDCFEQALNALEAAAEAAEKYALTLPDMMKSSGKEPAVQHC